MNTKIKVFNNTPEENTPSLNVGDVYRHKNGDLYHLVYVCSRYMLIAFKDGGYWATPVSALSYDVFGNIGPCGFKLVRNVEITTY